LYNVGLTQLEGHVNEYFPRRSLFKSCVRMIIARPEGEREHALLVNAGHTPEVKLP
jgi:hypothetical protein